ncbi:MAG: tetratricopeptide repeat protein [Planctomycetota bacterium]
MSGRAATEGAAEAERRYTTTELARLCGVGAASVRAWIARGLLPAPRARSQAAFGFRELVRGRTLARLLRAGWNAQRIARAVAAARPMIADLDAVLAGIDPEAGDLLAVRLPDGRLATGGGQGLLDFGSGGAAAAGVAAAGVRDLRSPMEWFQIGVDAESAGRLDDAVRAYERSLPVAGAEAHFNLGNCRYQLRDLPAAEAAFAAAVAEEPDYAEAWNNLGIVRGARQRRAEAIAAFEQALRIRPHYADAHYNLADVLAAMGDTARARTHWRAYLGFDPNSRWAEQVRRRLAGEGGDAG